LVEVNLDSPYPMANNFTLSPEDHLLWQQRAPRASYWLRVSDTHPFINGGRPIPEFGLPPPPPYTPSHPPTPVPSTQAHLSNVQGIPNFSGVIHPGVTTFPPTGQVPIYDIHRHVEPAQVVPRDSRPALPPRKPTICLFRKGVINDILPGFTVSVPLKQLSHRDIPSRAEIAFEWDIPLLDFHDRVCARMDLDSNDAVLGYKFETDPKKSIIQLPSNDSVAFGTHWGQGVTYPAITLWLHCDFLDNVSSLWPGGTC
jgi:hypothetical protein